MKRTSFWLVEHIRTLFESKHWQSRTIPRQKMVSLNFLVNILRLRSICFTSWTTSCFTGDFAVPVLGIPGFRRSGRSGVSRGRSFDRYAARRRVAGGGHAVVDIACAATCNYNKNVTRNRRNSSQIKCEKVEINLSTKAWQATIVN